MARVSDAANCGRFKRFLHSFINITSNVATCLNNDFDCATGCFIDNGLRLLKEINWF